MPRKRSPAPAYLYHVSGQARVRLAGVDFYLGPHGSPESLARYHALLAEYNANGRQAPAAEEDESVRMVDDAILVKHVTADFRVRVLPTTKQRAPTRPKQSLRPTPHPESERQNDLHGH